MKTFASFLEEMESKPLPFAFGSISNRQDLEDAVNEIYHLSIPHDPDTTYEDNPEEYRKFKELEQDKSHDGVERTASSLTDFHHPYGSRRREEKTNQQNVLSYYTGTSRQINRYLIDLHKKDPWASRTPQSAIEAVPKLNEEIDKEKPAPFDFHVHTGIGQQFNIAELRKKHNDVVHFPAFTSTSLNPSIASGFATDKALPHPLNPFRYPEVARIHIPKGFRHGIYVGDTSMIHEEEYILRNGTNLRFHGKPRIWYRRGPENYATKYPILVHDATIEE